MENQLYIALKGNKLFSDVEIEDLEMEGIRGRLVSVKEGEILFREGDQADNIYLVVSGEINLIKKKLLGSSKGFVFNENDFFGYDEIAENTARTSTAVALKDTYLIAFSTYEIDQLVDQNHIIKTNLHNFSSLSSKFENIDKEENDVIGKEPEENGDEETGSQEELAGESKISSDVSSFEHSLKDDLIDKHESSIEENASPYEEELKDEEYHKIHDEELPEKRAKHNLEQTGEDDEPLFPDDDADEDKTSESGDSYDELHKPEYSTGFEDTEAGDSTGEKKESFEDDSSFDESVYDAIESAESISDEEPKQSERYKDFDEDFYTAFSGSDEDKEENENEDKSGERPQDISNEDLEDAQKFSMIDRSLDSYEENKDENDEGITGEKDEVDNFAEDHDSGTGISFSSEYDDSGEDEIEQDKAEEIEEPESGFPGRIEEESKSGKTNIGIDEEKGMLTEEHLRQIIKASQIVNTNVKIDEVLDNIVNVATDLTSADRGTLYLVDNEKEELWSKVAMGDEVKQIHLKIGEGLAGWVVQNRELINIEDASQDSRFKSDFDRSSGYKTKSVLCFPIKNREDEIVGVLQLLNSKKGRFTQLDEEFLSAISIQCALALQNAELVEKLLETERVTSLGKMTNFLIQDIKKPVLVSKRYAEHVRAKDLPNDAAQIIDMILDQLSQVADLVQTTSNYSEGKAVLRTSRTGLNEAFQDFSDRLDSYVRTRNCSIENQFDNDVKVNLDSKEFFQAYNHIIRNACDAMPEGGAINITTKVDNDNVKILFQDQGLGIPESIIDKLFEPFMTHGKKEGTGLGLTIVKKIVEGHNGTIEVESMLGDGTTFIITLPVSSAF